MVLGAMGLIAVTQMQSNLMKLEQAQARQLGLQMYQYNNAVRRWVAQNAGETGSHTGVNWLKDSSCGGSADEEFLPCNFPDRFVLGNLQAQTTVTLDGEITRARTELGALQVGSSLRADLAGLAALTASGGAINNLLPTMAATDASFSSNPLTAEITIEASNNASTDVWLRTDGANSMHATLNFDGSDDDDRNITGVNRITSVAGKLLRLGGADSNVLIDADAEVAGILRARSSLDVSTDADIGRDLSVGRDASVGRDLRVSRNAMVSGDVMAKRLVDADNYGFYMDPASTSQLNSATLSGILTAGRVQADEVTARNGSGGMSLSSSLITAKVPIQTSRVRNSANSRYIDTGTGTSQSRLSRLRVDDNLSVHGNISAHNDVTVENRLHVKDDIRSPIYRILGTNSVGGSCDHSGSLSRTSGNVLLQCRGSPKRWVEVGGGVEGGRYVSRGNQYWTYTRLNNSSMPIMVHARGGNCSASGNSSNPFHLVGSVSGSGVIVQSANNHVDYKKIGSISFMVPAGRSYTVESRPNCSWYGNFDVREFHFEG